MRAISKGNVDRFNERLVVPDITNVNERGNSPAQRTVGDVLVKRVVFACMTAVSIEKRWVNAEIDSAIHRHAAFRLPLIPVLYTADPWQRQVLAVGSGYFRTIGAADVLIDKAQEIDQAWLRGIGIARHIQRKAAWGAGKESCGSPSVGTAPS